MTSPAKTVGLLHPGAMGVTVGAAAAVGGSRVVWASEGRSEATSKRARDAGLEDAGSLAAVLDQADVVLSVCPPHAALDLAREVGATFDGLFVDANAVSPETARQIGAAGSGAGAELGRRRHRRPAGARARHHPPLSLGPSRG